LGATENEKPYNTGGEMMTATLKGQFGNVIGLIYNPDFNLKNIRFYIILKLEVYEK